MTNPFSTDNLINEFDFPLTKGGEGSGRYPKGSGLPTLSVPASVGNQAGLARKLADSVSLNETDSVMAQDKHREIARACEGAMKSAVLNDLTDLAVAYGHAAELHRQAASAHTNAIAGTESRLGAWIASDNAAGASERADELNYE